ncbi:MAG: hypothetical protein HGA95_01695, partial [Caldiserica bacterium]|nr:hypothetical protein [Caldisericota bacterium]
VSGCYATGNVSGTGHHIAGFSGSNQGIIKDCFSTGSVTGGTGNIAGFCGENWNAQLKSGVWSQPVATDDKLYVLSVIDASKNQKSGIHVFGLKDNFGKELRSLDVSIVESANIQKYDDAPVATPAITPTTDGKTALVFGDNEGRVLLYQNEILKSNYTLGIGTPISTSPTISDGKIYISSSNKRTYILGLEDTRLTYGSIQTQKIVSTSVTVWQNYAMMGDNSGTFYIFNKDDGEEVKRIPIEGIDTIRSSACIATVKGKTYAVFGSNKGRIHKVRLDSGSFETDSKFVTGGSGSDEFWATPTFYDGYIYIGNENNFLYKIDLETMAVVSKINLNNSIFAQSVINNGFLYVTTANRINNTEDFKGSLFILKLDDFKVFGREYVLDGGSYASPMFAANRLFVASRTGKVYCFKGMQPNVTVSPEKLSFPTIAYDANSVEPINIKITNSTSYTYITGSIRTDPENPWLKVSKQTFDGNSTTLSAWVDTSEILNRSGTLESTIYVDYLFGLEQKTLDIPVKVSFEPKPPVFNLSKSEINIKAKNEDVIESVNVNLKEYDSDQEVTFVAKPSSSSNWFQVENPTFVLSRTKSSASVTISVKPAELLKKNQNIYQYKGGLEISCIYRNKPTGTKTVSVSLQIEKDFKIAVPFIDEKSISKTLTFDELSKGMTEKNTFHFTNKAKSKYMSISKTPTVDYSDSPEKDWIRFEQSFPLQQDENFNIDLFVTTDTKIFKPNQNYSARIKVLFDTGEQIELTVKYTTLTLDKIKMKFVIGSTTYWVGDETKKMSTSPFISSKGNTMVPIRPVADTLGYYYNAKITWMADIQTITLEMGDKTLRLVIGHNKAYIDNPDGSITEKALSSPPEIKNGSTFIPPKIITDTFGGKANWDSATKTVTFEFVNPRLK